MSGRKSTRSTIVRPGQGGRRRTVTYFAPHKKLMAKAMLPMGSRNSVVTITLSKVGAAGEPGFGLRIECNPRKLGVSGFHALADALQQAAPVHLNLPAVLTKAGVTRLDVAIDLAGITPGELIVRNKYKTKTVSYRGSDDHLETIYLHRDKKAHDAPVNSRKPLGKLDLKVYDRNRYQAFMGKPPSYDGVQVTRLEVVRTRFHKAFGLADIPMLPNLFSHVAVRDRDSLNPWDDQRRWRTYVACRSQMPSAEAAHLAGLDKWQAKYAETIHQGVSAEILTGDVWGGWHTGLEACGLQVWIEMAKAGVA